MKIPAISPLKREPAHLAEQIYITESDDIVISVPKGYVLMACTEVLPLIDQSNYGTEKKLSGSHNEYHDR